MNNDGGFNFFLIGIDFPINVKEFHVLNNSDEKDRGENSQTKFYWLRIF